MSVIAISGQPGAGSTTTARLLAERLGHYYFSPGRVFKDLSRGVAHTEPYFNELKRRCDKVKLSIPTLSSSNDSSGALNLWNTPFGKDPRLHSIIDDLQKSIASNGNVVIDGKLSLHMLKSAKLKVWLKASKEKRSERVFERDGVLPEEAKAILTKRESLERQEWEKIYGFDYWTQESMADMVIDTTYKSPSQVALEIEQRISGV